MHYIKVCKYASWSAKVGHIFCIGLALELLRIRKHRLQYSLARMKAWVTDWNHISHLLKSTVLSANRIAVCSMYPIKVYLHHNFDEVCWYSSSIKLMLLPHKVIYFSELSRSKLARNLLLYAVGCAGFVRPNYYSNR